MAELLTDSQPAAFSPGDIIYALFKHKWKVLFGAVAGTCAAIIAYNLYTPLYESQAKLLVRYVLDRSTVDPEAGAQPRMAESVSVMASECEILTSWDLAIEVVDGVGVRRLIPGADPTQKTEAASTIAGGLRVMAQGNIIFVAYSNRDPELATLVLNELVNRYFNKHLEVHRSAGAFDFVTQQTDQVRARLNETEDQLRTLKARAGIISLGDSYAALSGSLTRLDDQIRTTEEEIIEQRSRIKFMEDAMAQTGASDDTQPRPPTGSELQQYQALVGRLAGLHQQELELLARYTAENQFVKANQAQIKKLEQQREEMEKRLPELATAKEGQPVTLVGEKARLTALEAKLEGLTMRLGRERQRVGDLSEVGAQIADLERNQELLLNSYKYFKSTVEKARIDEALDPSKIPNITAVQRPTPPRRVYGKRNKTALAFAGGGLGVVVLFVLLRELVLNPTFKRSLDLEKRLGAPLLLSIPYNPKAAKKRRPLLGGPKAGNGKNGHLAPWDAEHFIRPFAVAIRDRLGLYFELNRMTHKPKLVGVTGFSEGSGTSTLAAGLASALSEMGEGKVLLVDVNLGPHEVHPFFKGRPAVSFARLFSRTVTKASPRRRTSTSLRSVSRMNRLPSLVSSASST